MANLTRLRSITPVLHLSVTTDRLALAIVFLLAVVTSQVVQAQSFNVLHSFTGGNDGGNPSAGVVYRSGSFYGTTWAGGPQNHGVIYQLKSDGSGWTLNAFYSLDGSDGQIPSAPVVFGPDGALYSTTEFGSGHGNIFKLTPMDCGMERCLWLESVLYTFQGGTGDGSKPIGLIFDRAGNLYGTTSSGGAYGNGTVYKLSCVGDGCGSRDSDCQYADNFAPLCSVWTEGLLHSFDPSTGDGFVPYRSVLLFDNAGNLYGTTYFGGQYNAGTVFELTPSESGWTESVIYSFAGSADGRYPYSGLIIDQSGNLYGTTTDGGSGGGGTVFKLSPSDGGWTYSVLYSLTGSIGDSCGPAWALTMDAVGNLYDTTGCDGAYGFGNVFKLTKTGGSWRYTSLYDFTGGNDGSIPISGVTFDASGNLYGTTYYGGIHNAGVVWEIMPEERVFRPERTHWPVVCLARDCSQGGMDLDQGIDLAHHDRNK